MRSCYRKSFILFIFYLLLNLFYSCSDDDGQDEPYYNGRTVLVYMAADNDLDSYVDDNIIGMVNGMTGISGRIVIYVDRSRKNPQLLTIQGGKHPQLDTVINYKEENSASSLVLRRVIDDTRRLFPSDSYGLILWSHGGGWYPSSEFMNNSSKTYNFMDTEIWKTKHFGLDMNPQGTFEINQLREGLNYHFDFILFDACFMSSVEALYELRECTDYFIASPTEIWAQGFPYQRFVRYMWGGIDQLKKLCYEYYNFYNTLPASDYYRTATISLIDANELQGLSLSVHDIIGNLEPVDFTDVWKYPVTSASMPDFFDLGSYIYSVATQEQLETFKTQLNKTVVYKLSTPFFYKYPIPEENFSGLSIYILQNEREDLNEFYKNLSWYQDTFVE